MGLLPSWCLVFVVLCVERELAICRGQSSSSRLTSEGRPNSISGDQVLVSPEGSFALGFFTPAAINGNNVASTATVANSKTSSGRYYLGIWYDNISEKTVLWVANREKPVLATTNTSNNHSGILRITDDGNLVVFDGDGGAPLWSSNSTGSSENTTTKLLESGNLVLTRGVNDSIVWQSFEHPTDTFIHGMRLSFNLKTGIGQQAYAWKIPGEDPALGPVSAGFDPKSPVQIVFWNGSNVLRRVGIWNNETSNIAVINNGTSTMEESIVKNDVEVYHTLRVIGLFSTWRMSLDVVHGLTGYLLMPKTNNWTAILRLPRPPCEIYNRCGPFGICIASEEPPCKCLQGFQPKNHTEWYAGNFAGGCVRQVDLNGCGGLFVKFTKMKFPDKFTLLTNMSARQCEAECRRSCDCIAHAYANLSNEHIKDLRCFLWYGKQLNDLGLVANVGGDLYVRIASSKKSKKLVLAVMVPVLFISILLISTLFYFLRKRHLKIKGQPEINTKTKKIRVLGGHNAGAATVDNGNPKDFTTTSLVDFPCILAATDDFSPENKLGKGGFGSVYKGKLLNGQEIAVKRLSKGSGQGLQEFINEIELIGKLQHTNLVQLLGWCAHDDERILIYEYLPNKSLDKIIFDTSLSATLDWKQRYCIIEGIAQGILYLHKYSRVRIIHRDLKTSNILLDHAMNPKISDFGLARIFEANQTEVETKRVVGTYGYMSPEYAMGGFFSEKTDVFSFGVIVLEIITGKRNTGFYPYKESITLLGYVWQVWKEGRVSDLIDKSMATSSSTTIEDIARCIHVGLLCLQENTLDRPTMSSVISFLADENMTNLPTPKKLAFAIGIEPDTTSLTEYTITESDSLFEWPNYH